VGVVWEAVVETLRGGGQVLHGALQRIGSLAVSVFGIEVGIGLALVAELGLGGVVTSLAQHLGSGQPPPVVAVDAKQP